MHEVIDLLMRNSRLPRSVWGDMHAQITACRTGERRLVALHERFGSETVAAAAEAIFDQCERLDREAVAAIPDGVYRAEGSMDSDGPGGEPVHVAVTVTVAGDRVTVDLTGSSGPTRHSVNAPFPGTVAGVRLAYKCLINPTRAGHGGHVPQPRRRRAGGHRLQRARAARDAALLPAARAGDRPHDQGARAGAARGRGRRAAGRPDEHHDRRSPPRRHALGDGRRDRGRLGRARGRRRLRRPHQLRRGRPQELSGRGDRVALSAARPAVRAARGLGRRGPAPRRARDRARVRAARRRHRGVALARALEAARRGASSAARTACRRRARSSATARSRS